MVLEWVDGRLLRQILNEQKKLPPERAIRITLAIVQSARIRSQPGRGASRPEARKHHGRPRMMNVKLIDFGIAANAGSRRLTFAKLTEAMGTPDYISPEQVKGKRGDARSDVYSLGIMFYEMLTGKVPFMGPNPFVIMNERLLNSPIPPREVNPEVTPELQEIIYRALERDPSKRYPNMREFALDLEHPEKVGVADREEIKNWKQRRSPASGESCFTSCWP